MLSTVGNDKSGNSDNSGDSGDSGFGNVTDTGRRRLEEEAYVSEKRARAIVAFLAFIATVLTGWLSYSVWKSTSEIGYPDKYCVYLREPPRHRADAATEARRVVGVGCPKFDFHRGAVHPADVEKGDDSKNDANNDDVAVTAEPAPQGARDGED